MLKGRQTVFDKAFVGTIVMLVFVDLLVFCIIYLLPHNFGPVQFALECIQNYIIEHLYKIRNVIAGLNLI